MDSHKHLFSVTDEGKLLLDFKFKGTKFTFLVTVVQEHCYRGQLVRSVTNEQATMYGSHGALQEMFHNPRTALEAFEKIIVLVTAHRKLNPVERVHIRKLIQKHWVQPLHIFTLVENLKSSKGEKQWIK